MTGPTTHPDLLLAYALAHPDGWTQQTVGMHYGWNRNKTSATVRALRLMLAEDDTVNLVCQPYGRGPWIYRLVGDLVGEGWWRQNRLADSTSRLETIRAVNRSLIAGTSGRTAEGKRVRMIDRELGRLLEDLVDLADD